MVRRSIRILAVALGGCLLLVVALFAIGWFLSHGGYYVIDSDLGDVNLTEVASRLENLTGITLPKEVDDFHCYCEGGTDPFLAIRFRSSKSIAQGFIRDSEARLAERSVAQSGRLGLDGGSILDFKPWWNLRQAPVEKVFSIPPNRVVVLAYGFADDTVLIWTH